MLELLFICATSLDTITLTTDGATFLTTSVVADSSFIETFLFWSAKLVLTGTKLPKLGPKIDPAQPAKKAIIAMTSHCKGSPLGELCLFSSIFSSIFICC